MKLKVGDYVKCIDGYLPGAEVYRIVRFDAYPDTEKFPYTIAYFRKGDGCFIKRLRKATKSEILAAVLAGTVNTNFNYTIR